MAALNFPNSPSLNDTHTENGVTFKWNGAAWDRLGDIGAQGSAGAAGAQGAQGATGSTGSQGATGPVAGSSTQVVYKDGSNNPSGSANFTFDGTNLSVSGNVSIGGTLTYEDVTNIDSVGIITARLGVKVPDSQTVFLGTDDDLRIFHDGSQNAINSYTSNPFNIISNGNTTIKTNNNDSMAVFKKDNAVELFYDNTKKFETTSYGSNVTGDLRITDNSARLQLYDANASSNTQCTGGLEVYDQNGNRGAWIGLTESASSIHFGIYGSDVARIASDGTLNLDYGAINLGAADSSSGHINAYELMTFNIDSDNDDTNRHFTWYKNGFNGGGTGMMRLTEDGRLVIGGDLATSANNLTLKHASTVEIDMNCTGGSGNNFRIKSDSNGTFTIRDHSAGFDKITILDSGLVGINKTDPAKHLHVGGNMAMNQTNGLLFFAKDGEGVNTNTNNTHWIGRVDNAGYHATTGAGGFNSVAGSFAIGAKGPLMFATSANNDTYSTGRMIITADGKLGLGVASPTEMMDISNASGTGSQIQFRDNGTGVGSNDGLRVGYNGSGGQMWNFENTYIRFATNNNERVRIASDGKFGIGTASPTNKLHVYSSDDTGEIRIGGGNGAGNHRIFIQAHPSTAYIDSYGNNTHNPLYINADPLILNNSGSGKVLIKTTTSNDNQAHLVVNGTTDSGNIVTGRIHDSINNNNTTVLLFRMNQSNGFQFSGDIITNSWTGNAKVNCHITVRYTDQAVEVDVINATHSAQIAKTGLRVVTADYGSNRYLGIQKNGGGTGVFYINAFVGTNIDSSGNGGIREVANSSLGNVTTHGNLN